MPKGGAKPGERRGGRQKGALNKLTEEMRRDAIEMAASGEQPLAYMLRVMRDPDADVDRRDRMAISAATFVHPKLANIEANINATVNHEDTLDRVAKAKAAGLI